MGVLARSFLTAVHQQYNRMVESGVVCELLEQQRLKKRKRDGDEDEKRMSADELEEWVRGQNEGLAAYNEEAHHRFVVDEHNNLYDLSKTSCRLLVRPHDRVLVSSRRGDKWKKMSRLDSKDLYCTRNVSSLAAEPYQPAPFRILQSSGTQFLLTASEGEAVFYTWSVNNWKQASAPARTSFPVFVGHGGLE